ncbi:hypothetical protein P153DRAFT_412698 [Dothidotthia symphoricarpi CBS 119687]|uniref:Uncharacterized protein n=1 Tax=Dothidotthia symphoricarpi CBS 119687 TaxID=1392245 RepID=A0A6A5ZX28_9PLEO|nr:uncharacterized protein P153DRAFT_412698 [Dothidotthia symphoricarpi CBS 119687]KAF2123575.1 hypothetical protein P153DRAFT_412698 [Dothidotthia symphoricarpi CBS 119687]
MNAEEEQPDDVDEPGTQRPQAAAASNMTKNTAPPKQRGHRVGSASSVKVYESRHTSGQFTRASDHSPVPLHQNPEPLRLKLQSTQTDLRLVIDVENLIVHAARIGPMNEEMQTPTLNKAENIAVTFLLNSSTTRRMAYMMELTNQGIVDVASKPGFDHCTPIIRQEMTCNEHAHEVNYEAKVRASNDASSVQSCMCFGVITIGILNSRTAKTAMDIQLLPLERGQGVNYDYARAPNRLLGYVTSSFD